MSAESPPIETGPYQQIFGLRQKYGTGEVSAKDAFGAMLQIWKDHLDLPEDDLAEIGSLIGSFGEEALDPGYRVCAVRDVLGAHAGRIVGCYYNGKYTREIV